MKRFSNNCFLKKVIRFQSRFSLILTNFHHILSSFLDHFLSHFSRNLIFYLHVDLVNMLTENNTKILHY